MTASSTLLRYHNTTMRGLALPIFLLSLILWASAAAAAKRPPPPHQSHVQIQISAGKTQAGTNTVRHLLHCDNNTDRVDHQVPLPYINVKGKKSLASGGGRGGDIGFKELNTLGSRPPSCAHRCRGCNPCAAIQVPTTSGGGGGRFKVQYTNYEPEGWKCKCGSSFYNP